MSWENGDESVCKRIKNNFQFAFETEIELIAPLSSTPPKGCLQSSGSQILSRNEFAQREVTFLACLCCGH